MFQVGEEMLIVFEDAAAKPVVIQCEADLAQEVIAKEENSCTFSFTLPQGKARSGSSFFTKT